MKYLYIIRHAKAESPSREVEDHDRKLINKGIKRANNLNKWLKSKNHNLEALFCSSSLRNPMIPYNTFGALLEIKSTILFSRVEVKSGAISRLKMLSLKINILK